MTTKKQRKFDFSVDIKLNLIYNIIIKGKGGAQMSKKGKKNGRKRDLTNLTLATLILTLLNQIVELILKLID